MPTDTLEPVQRLIADEMRAVDAVIRERLYSDVALVRQVCEHIISGGGKRLRPALVVLASGACGYSGSAHYQLAAVVEFIHTATLLHDDVVDESSLRRGRATANAIFGNAASVLVGDFLYSRAFQMMVELNDMRVMEVLANATNTIAEGEVLQLLNCNDPDVTEDGYLRVIRYKTAKLFEAAAQLGAIVGHASREVEEGLARYGMHLGTAFQLIDDVLDYSGDHANTGKNLGDDLAEGKPTLPLIIAMKNGNEAQSATIRAAIERGGLDEFQPVLTTIHETGALDYARRQAETEAKRAITSLDALPNSPCKDSLIQLAAFAVTRSY
ncbi:MAG TPA: octaprenyl diphosphate synthase [Burkholderiales bacterium]|nr:octaprenyl diphosphate synthase [Burkholderiales bacterium]